VVIAGASHGYFSATPELGEQGWNAEEDLVVKMQEIRQSLRVLLIPGVNRAIARQSGHLSLPIARVGLKPAYR